jgi:hypothetical protein
MDDTPVIRAILGQVVHADGTVTHGLHVPNADGTMVFVDLTAETIDWDRWQWASRTAGTILHGEEEDDTP